MGGKKCWYIVDGYRPPAQPPEESGYEGHECFMILNTNDTDAHVLIDIYYEEKDPVEGISFTVPAKRIRAFRSGDKSVLGGLELNVNEQYSMRFRSDIGVVVQYGRLDIAQPNMAFLATMGYAE
jgi:hypothetical protein